MYTNFSKLNKRRETTKAVGLQFVISKTVEKKWSYNKTLAQNKARKERYNKLKMQSKIEMHSL